jgi:hypothetical protein
MVDRLRSYLPQGKTAYTYVWEDFVEECIREAHVEMSRQTLYTCNGEQAGTVMDWWNANGDDVLRQSIWSVLERRRTSRV